MCIDGCHNIYCYHRRLDLQKYCCLLSREIILWPCLVHCNRDRLTLEYFLLLSTAEVAPCLPLWRWVSRTGFLHAYSMYAVQSFSCVKRPVSQTVLTSYSCIAEVYSVFSTGCFSRSANEHSAQVTRKEEFKRKRLVSCRCTHRPGKTITYPVLWTRFRPSDVSIRRISSLSFSFPSFIPFFALLWTPSLFMSHRGIWT